MLMVTKAKIHEITMIKLLGIEKELNKKNELIASLVQEIQQLKQQLNACTCKYSEIEDDLD